jgi:hypothetical protein
MDDCELDSPFETCSTPWHKTYPVKNTEDGEVVIKYKVEEL